MIYDSDPRLPKQGGGQERGASSPPSRATRVLLIVAATVALVIVAGTVFAFASGARQRKLASEAAAHPADGQATFTGVGTLRAATLDAKPAIVVATIAFPYNGSDRAFKEELLRKAPALKAAAIDWFSRRKAEELAPAYEGRVKAALRDTFNSLLSLGKVDEIWLSDFSVVQ